MQTSGALKTKTYPVSQFQQDSPRDIVAVKIFDIVDLEARLAKAEEALRDIVENAGPDWRWAGNRAEQALGGSDARAR